MVDDTSQNEGIKEDEEDCLDEDNEVRLAELVELYMEKIHAGEVISPLSFANQYPEEKEELLGLISTLESVQSMSYSHRMTHADFTFPEYLGGYQLLKKIGRGGMGTVFRALQVSLQREVAIKILAPSWNDDEHHREAFENESRLIASLRHVNIVEVYGAGKEGAYRYYVMELVDGESLSPRLIREYMPLVLYPKAVAQVGLQAAKAIAFAHANGVLHRDVKPGNLLLDKKGVIHVSDFGLATILNKGEAAPLVTMSHDGTLRYMAPERLMKGECSFKVDQYALGLTLYEVLTRKPAFVDNEPGQLIKRICDKPVKRLQDEGELGAIINKSISYHPDDRYPSMQEMVADLQRYLDGVPVLASRASLWRRYSMWVNRRRAVALWSHAAAVSLMMLMGISVYANISVSQAYKNETDQRVLAERNAEVADASLKRIFDSIGSLPTQNQQDDSYMMLPSASDVRLMQDLLPYYAEIALQDSNSAEITSAHYVLASIALRTGDYALAEQYFTEACSGLSHDSSQFLECQRGLTNAIIMQGDLPKVMKSVRELHACVSQNIHSTDEDERIAMLKALQLLIGHTNNFQKNSTMQKLCDQAVAIFCRMKEDNQASIARRLMQLDFMMEAPRISLSKHYADLEERPEQLVQEILDLDPDNLSAKRSYVKILLKYKGNGVPRELKGGPEGGPKDAPRVGGGGPRPQEQVGPRHDDERHPVDEPRQIPPNLEGPAAGLGPAAGRKMANDDLSEQDLQTAITYAQAVLAAAPDDLEAVYLYLTIRGRYADWLRKNDRDQDANSENERTLGVLSFLSSQEDFLPELREKLVMMVASRPVNKASSDQREKELLLLMRSFDEKKAEVIRKRIAQSRQKARQRHEAYAHQRKNGSYRKSDEPIRKQKPSDQRSRAKASNDSVQALHHAPLPKVRGKDEASAN